MGRSSRRTSVDWPASTSPKRCLERSATQVRCDPAQRTH